MNLTNIKQAPQTSKPNKLLIPITRITIEEFNEMANYLKERYEAGTINKGFKRTKSGGISYLNNEIQYYNLNCYEVMAKNGTAEIMIISYYEDKDDIKPLICRLQTLNNNINDEKLNNICGHKAYFILREELKKDGVIIEDYYIKHGADIKAEIMPPHIEILDDSIIDLELNNVNHIDINSAYPYYMAEYMPQFKPTIERLYAGRKEKPIYKNVLNMSCGYFQSKLIGYRLAHISKYAVNSTRQRIDELIKYIRSVGRMPILTNTDGVYYIGDVIEEFNSVELGGIKTDHKNMKFRIKSKGAYEYIEDGIYTPVVRGLTTLDKIKPRTAWTWGDIYSAAVLMYNIDDWGIITRVEERGDE